MIHLWALGSLLLVNFMGVIPTGKALSCSPPPYNAHSTLEEMVRSSEVIVIGEVVAVYRGSEGEDDRAVVDVEQYLKILHGDDRVDRVIIDNLGSSDSCFQTVTNGGRMIFYLSGTVSSDEFWAHQVGWRLAEEFADPTHVKEVLEIVKSHPPDRNPALTEDDDILSTEQPLNLTQREISKSEAVMLGAVGLLAICVIVLVILLRRQAV